MSTLEIAVILGGGLLGYWLVGGLLSPRQPPRPLPGQDEKAHEAPPVGQSEEDISTCWYRILEVDEYATLTEIENAYKLKIRQYHPDKVATLGPELQALAEEKSREINRAHDYARQLRSAH